MKKLITALLILAALLFTGCKHNAKEKDDGTVSKTIKIDRDGEVYLIKLNPTYRTIYGSDSGYIKKLSRSAAEEDLDSIPRELYKKYSEIVEKKSAARAADNTLTISTDINHNLKNVKKGDTKDFWTIISTKEKVSKVHSECKYAGRHCIIYANDENKNLFKSESSPANYEYINDSAYEILGSKFDDAYEKEIKINGDPLYTSHISNYFAPSTTMITILVSDLYGDASPDQQSFVAGYFSPSDLFTNNLNNGINEDNNNYIKTNECEMIYIDTFVLKENPEMAWSTSVHEFNHLINFVFKTLKTLTHDQKKWDYRQECDVWFTEMLSMVTEDMFQTMLEVPDEDSPKGRLPYFGLFYNYGFHNWDKLESYISYANTYAFGAFLARNFGGIPLIKEIAQNNYVNERAITEALQTINPNMTYVDPVTNETKKVDFTFALQKFVNCVIFPESSSEYSLNKGNGFTNEYGSKIGFSPIDIRWDVEYLGKYYRLPRKFSREKGEQPDLYSYGFSVHHVGTNISSFTLTMPKESSLEYYYIIK